MQNTATYQDLIKVAHRGAQSPNREWCTLSPCSLPQLSPSVVLPLLSFRVPVRGSSQRLKVYYAHHIFQHTAPAFKNEVISLHNKARAHYGARPVTWNDALYPATLQWANACKFQHRLVRETLVSESILICGYSQSGGKYGENLVCKLVLCSLPAIILKKFSLPRPATT